jgi:hypothetical protein
MRTGTATAWLAAAFCAALSFVSHARASTPYEQWTWFQSSATPGNEMAGYERNPQ